jgi:hypothetical protein
MSGVPLHNGQDQRAGDAGDAVTLTARSYYMEFFQLLFGRKEPHSYRWSPDSKISELTITVEMPIQQETLTDRPCLAVARGPGSFSHLGWDDVEGRSLITGQKKKVALFNGTMVLNLVSRTALESERLAYYCADELLSRRDWLQRRGFFDIGQNCGVGSPSPAGAIVENDGGEGFYSTSVTSPYILPWVSYITPLNQPIHAGTEVTMQVAAETPCDRKVRVFNRQPFASQRAVFSYPHRTVASCKSKKPTTVKFGV